MITFTSLQPLNKAVCRQCCHLATNIQRMCIGKNMQNILSNMFQRTRALAGIVKFPKRCLGQPAAKTHPHLVQAGEVTPGITQLEYRQRRYNLMQKISENVLNKTVSNHIVIIPAAAKTYMTQDIPYPYRQNTEFFYLSGFLEPDSLLILEGKHDSLPDHKATLFVPKKDPHKELWDGPRSGIDGAIEITGVDYAYNVEDLQAYLGHYLRDKQSFMTWYDYGRPAHREYHNKEIAQFLKETNFQHIMNPRPLIHSLRVIKSPAESKLMQKTCDIASKAFVNVMKSSHPGVNEAHLYAKMDYECRIQGADFLAYPPVVAGGNRANTIHYISNNQLIQDGELVLMDAGCECHGYTSDVTRTWPISGQFTNPQRELYEALLEVQEECFVLCGQSDVTMDDMFVDMLSLLGTQLKRLKMIDSDVYGVTLQKKARQFCPHHVSHYLGMDVHDTDEISRSFKLVPGMCLTIEPGIYIPENCPHVPKEFCGMGIRIEDDVLISENGPINLTAKCPKHPADIEAVMKDT